MAKISGWPLGINNVAHDTALPEGSLRDAVDVDLDEAGKPRSRQGSTQVYAGTSCHSVFKHGSLVLFAEGADLKRLLPDNTAVTIYSGLAANSTLTYAEVNDEIYWSDGVNIGIVDTAFAHKIWGVTNPHGQPTISVAAFGGLHYGKYQIAVTHENAQGEESGATLATVFELVNSGGLQLTNIPQNADAVRVNVYMTEADGDVMRLAGRIPMGVLTYTISSKAFGKALETQFMYTLPAGHIVRHDHGRVWVACGAQVWYSEPLRYGLCKPAENFFQFAEKITIMEMMSDGIYVVADKTYFLPGTDPEAMAQVLASPYKGIPGTGYQVPASIFNIENVQGQVAFWYSEKGAMIGLPGGQVQPVMEDRIALPSYDTGATTFKEVDGVRQLLTAVSGGGDESVFGVGDAVVTNIVRNGITIN